MLSINFILPMVLLIGLVVGLYWFMSKFTKGLKDG